MKSQDKKLCDFGCGQEAIKQFKSGNRCCSASANSCPEQRRRNSQSQPYHDPDRREKVLQKIQNSLIENLGENYKEEQGKRASKARRKNNPNTYIDAAAVGRQTNIEKYGFANPSQIPEIKEKKQQTCFNNFGVYNPTQSSEVKEKTYNTLVITQRIVPREQRDEKRLYRDKVDEYTLISWNQHFSKINPKRRIRGVDSHLDHIFSISKGFFENIPPEIIGHWTNLQMLSPSENLLKGARCDKTKEELYEDYHKALLLESNN